MISGHRYFAIAGMLILSACAGAVSDVLVNIPRHQPPEGTSELKEVASTTIRVSEFRQTLGTGVLPGRIGERKTIGDISMGLVTIKPTPSRLVRDAFAAELEAAGHRQVSSGENALIEGQVQKFHLHTDVTALYWDVIVNTAVSATIRVGASEQMSNYAAVCKERTYSWPSEEIMARVTCPP